MILPSLYSTVEDINSFAQSVIKRKVVTPLAGSVMLCIPVADVKIKLFYKKDMADALKCAQEVLDQWMKDHNCDPENCPEALESLFIEEFFEWAEKTYQGKEESTSYPKWLAYWLDAYKKYSGNWPFPVELDRRAYKLLKTYKTRFSE